MTSPAARQTDDPLDHKSEGIERPVQRISLSSDVLTERIGGEVAVLNLKTNRFFLLNSTGARLWELLGSGNDLSSIEEQLCAEFEVDPVELAGEVKRMLRLLEDEQLILFNQK